MDRIKLRPANSKIPFPEPKPTICCVSPHGGDRLRLISFPRDLLGAFRIAVQTSWIKGIQSERIHHQKGWYEIKLRGFRWQPFNLNKAEGGVESCRLGIGIMRLMLSHGWGLEVSMNPQLKSSQDSWFFTKRDQETHVTMCGISFTSSDKIRVVDGYPDVTDAVLATIKKHWVWGLQRQGVHREAYEFKLKGFPWTKQAVKTHAAAFLMQLMLALRSAGWNVYASVGSMATPMNSEGQQGSLVDTWILKKIKP